jgi:hypothetical protein
MSTVTRIAELDRELRRQSTSRRLSLRGSRRPPKPVGHGRAWLIFDAGGELFKYQCYRMGRQRVGYPIEHAQAVTDLDGVRAAVPVRARAA